MGSINAELIRRCERARKAGDDEAYDRWAKLVDESQASCPHPPDERREQALARDSTSGKYRKGTVLRWCLRCSKVLTEGIEGTLGVVSTKEIT